jgi:WD40 repeat protein
MNPDRWRQIESLLHEALERPPGTREGFIRGRCGADDELADEVRSLLEVAEISGGFLEAPARGGVRALLAPREALPAEDAQGMVGDRLGPYRIQSVIASGGMGTVYAARREDDVYRKTVAVKVVRAAPDELDPGWHAERVARFSIEREVLAELDHPCIARMLDGGTTADGRPFLVMEYVEGQAIDAYCDRARLPIRERVGLFLRVCGAVVEAHQRLILHRDIKPGNILVRADGTPKLLDFGLAKPLDPLHAGLASATVDGRFMGTLAYAAPEQVAGDRTKQDTRSDLYALGLVLYRLLSGRHAYSTAGTVTEVLRRIAEEAPDPPSRFNPEVPRDLDVVTLKALAKEPARRYQSVGEFAADLERALAGDAVLARGDSRWYTLRKTVRRYRGPIVTAAALVALVGVFGVVMALQASTLARRSDQLAEALRQSNLARGRALIAAGSVAAAEAVLWPEHLDPVHDPDDEAYWALWELYSNRPCLRTLELPTATVSPLRPTPDGERLLIRGVSGGVFMLNARTGAEMLRIDTEPATEGTLVLTPAGDRVLIADGEGWLRVHDARTGLALASIPLGDDSLYSLRPCAAGVVACLGLSAVYLVEWSGGRAPVRIDTAGLGVRAGVLSPDGSVFYAGCLDGRVIAFDARTGRPQRTLLGERRWSLRLAVSDDGRYLAADTAVTEIVVIDLEAGRERLLTGASGWITALAIGRDASGKGLILASSSDKSAYLWELETGTLLRSFPGHAMPIYDAAIAPGGASVLTISHAVLREWELAPGLCSVRLPTASPIFDMIIARDGLTVLAAEGEGEFAIRLLDLADGRELDAWTGHEGTVSGIARDERTGEVYSVSYDGTLRRWSAGGRGGVLVRRENDRRGINSLAVAPGSGMFAYGTMDGHLSIHAPGGELLRTMRSGGPFYRVPSLAFSPDGAWLAAGTTVAEEITLLGLDRQPDIRFSAHAQTIRVLRFHPTLPLLASAGDDMSIRFWSMKRDRIGEPLNHLRGHESDIFELAFSPDGALLASGARSGEIKLWSVRSGACLLTLRPHADMVFALAFSPDGRTLYSSGRDGGIVKTDLTYYQTHIRGNESVQRSRWERDRGRTR